MLIFCVLLFSLIIRLINLNQSLWLDEAIQAWAISSFSLKDFFTKFSPTDVHPPLSYLINFFFSQIFGYSVIALRIPSVIFSLISIYLIYKLAKTFLPKKLSILPSILLATSGLHIYYSQEARMYSLVLMLVTASIYFLLIHFKTGKGLFYYFISSLAAIYSHYLAWFILPLHLLITFFTRKAKLKTILTTQLIMVFSYLPWLPILKTQVKAGLLASSTTWGNVVGGLNLKNLSLIPVKFLIGRISIDNNLYFSLTMLLPVLLVLYLFFILLRSKNQNKNTLFSWLIVPFLLAVIVSFKMPVLSYQRLFFTLPALYLLLSLAISLLPNKKQLFFIAALLMINIISSGVYLFNSRFHRENWKDLAAALKEKNTNNYPVAIISTVKAPLEYYYPKTALIDLPQITKIQASQTVWVIPYAQPIFHPTFDYHQTLTKKGFNQQFIKHFRGRVTLLKYTK